MAEWCDIMADKRNKSANLRSDCKIENSPNRTEIERRIMAFEPLRSIAEDYDVHFTTVHRFAARHGLLDKRIQDTEAVCNALIKKGMDAVTDGTMKIDGKVLMAAQGLRAKIRKEVDSPQTNINVQVVTPEQINDRINKANRLHPYVKSDN